MAHRSDGLVGTGWTVSFVALARLEGIAAHVLTTLAQYAGAFGGLSWRNHGDPRRDKRCRNGSDDMPHHDAVV